MSLSASTSPQSGRSATGDREKASTSPDPTSHGLAKPSPTDRGGTSDSSSVSSPVWRHIQTDSPILARWRTPWRVGLLASFVILAGLVVVWATLIRPTTSASDTTNQSAVEPASTGFDRVALRCRNLMEAGLTLETCLLQPISKTVEVAGVIEGDYDSEITIRARVSGVIRSVPAIKGKRVSQGEVLAIIESPELAQARLDHRARLREVQAAWIDAEWKTQVASGVERLVDALRQDPDALEVERRFAEIPLGNAREQLIQAYTACRTAQINLERQEIYVREGVVGSARLAQAAREAAAAQSGLESARDQVARDARQTALKAQQALKLAEGRAFDSRVRLEILGDDSSTIALIERLEDEPNSEHSGGLDWTAYLVRAPFDGAALDRPVGPGQQVERGEALFPFANLDHLHLVAKIPESLIGALPALGADLSFTTPSHPGRKFSARLESIGGQIEPANRSLPVLANVDNTDQSLKIGMAVRVGLVLNDPLPILSVPRASVQEIDGHSVVFELAPGQTIPTADPKDEETSRLFLARRVQLGEIRGDRQTILSGLDEGARIAVQGSFLLKSELVLQNEPEED